MRKVTQSAIRELNLDYAIKSISVGENHHYKIVMWDRTRNSSFSIWAHWEAGLSRELITQRVVQQLERRLAASHTESVRSFDAQELHPNGRASQQLSAKTPLTPLAGAWSL